MTRTHTILFLILLCLLLLFLYTQAMTIRYLQFQLSSLADDIELLFWDNYRLNDAVIWLIEDRENEERRAIMELREFLLGVQVEEFTVTAYTHAAPGGDINGTGDGLTSIGIPVREGIVAVDPQVIPYGSKVWLDGFGWLLAADTGGAIRGNRLDVFMDDLQSALIYGRQYGVKGVVVR